MAHVAAHSPGRAAGSLDLAVREDDLGRDGGDGVREAGEKADDLLEKVGLSHRRTHRPAELSGGEQQRAAVARALINDPPLLLADEPTGNLDEETGAAIMELFQSLYAERRNSRTIIMITHTPALCKFADITMELTGGKLRKR